MEFINVISPEMPSSDCHTIYIAKYMKNEYRVHAFNFSLFLSCAHEINRVNLQLEYKEFFMGGKNIYECILWLVGIYLSYQINVIVLINTTHLNEIKWKKAGESWEMLAHSMQEIIEREWKNRAHFWNEFSWQNEKLQIPSKKLRKKEQNQIHRKMHWLKARIFCACEWKKEQYKTQCNAICWSNLVIFVFYICSIYAE